MIIIIKTAMENCIREAYLKNERTNCELVIEHDDRASEHFIEPLKELFNSMKHEQTITIKCHKFVLSITVDYFDRLFKYNKAKRYVIKSPFVKHFVHVIDILYGVRRISDFSDIDKLVIIYCRLALSIAPTINDLRSCIHFETVQNIHLFIMLADSINVTNDPSIKHIMKNHLKSITTEYYDADFVDDIKSHKTEYVVSIEYCKVQSLNTTSYDLRTLRQYNRQHEIIQDVYDDQTMLMLRYARTHIPRLYLWVGDNRITITDRNEDDYSYAKIINPKLIMLIEKGHKKFFGLDDMSNCRFLGNYDGPESKMNYYYTRNNIPYVDGEKINIDIEYDSYASVNKNGIMLFLRCLPEENHYCFCLYDVPNMRLICSKNKYVKGVNGLFLTDGLSIIIKSTGGKLLFYSSIDNEEPFPYDKFSTVQYSYSM